MLTGIVSGREVGEDRQEDRYDVLSAWRIGCGSSHRILHDAARSDSLHEDSLDVMLRAALRRPACIDRVARFLKLVLTPCQDCHLRLNFQNFAQRMAEIVRIR
jgi:hypothetical protein